jgi:hypothetical protein
MLDTPIRTAEDLDLGSPLVDDSSGQPRRFPDPWWRRTWSRTRPRVLRYWFGALVMLVATLVFFLPLLPGLGTHMDGGDAMFNAWTLARNHHCILRDACPNYVDGNLFFPHADSMLYSETQLSAGVLTLPLHFISDNPIFAFNVWTIASCFLAGWFMYLFARHLSGGHELISILAGLVFAFAPFKVATLVNGHVQTLSIFYLPLALLLAARFLQGGRRWNLLALFPVLVLQFYASWYQMTFALIAMIAYVGLLLALRSVGVKRSLAVAATVVSALVATLPLAREYVRFSAANDARYSLGEQIDLSSQPTDYLIPRHGTLEGDLYHWLWPSGRVASYFDGSTYHGFILYAVAVGLVIVTYRRRRASVEANRLARQVFVLAGLFLVGFIISLGPVLKVGGHILASALDANTDLAVPLPYLLVAKLAPQLSFMRALSRATVLCLLALCGLLALLPRVCSTLPLDKRWRAIVLATISSLVVFELLPMELYESARPNAFSGEYEAEVPDVYQFIKTQPEVDNIIILASDPDLAWTPRPISQAEWVLWAGYHNKHIFNGFASYSPPAYARDYADFVTFDQNDIPRLRANDLRYVLVDKRLSTSNPQLSDTVGALLPQKLFEDDRYTLFKV